MKMFNEKIFNLRKILSLFCTMSVFVFASCNVALQESELVKIGVSISENTRMACPAFNDANITSFKLSCDGINKGWWQKSNVKNISAYEQMSSDFITVTRGVHTFQLTGSDVNGLNYSGKMSLNVTESTVLPFVLEFDSVSAGGTGSLNINVTFPNTGIKKITWDQYYSNDLKNYKNTQKVRYTDSTSVSSGTYSYKSSEVSAGCYIFEFNFYGDDDIPLTTPYPELIYITKGQNTIANITITEFDDVYDIIYDETSLGGATLTGAPQKYNWLRDVVLVTPERAGFDFTGWYEELDEEGKGVGNPVTGWKGDSKSVEVTLYATWAPKTFIAQFESYSEESPVQSQILLCGSKVTEPAAPSKEGFTFAGWYTSSSFGTEFDFDNSIITDNITLYARWSYSVSFDKNAEASTGSVSSVTHYSDDESDIILPESVFEYEGFTLLGWSIDQTAETPSYADGGKVTDSKTVFASGNTTLYAVWCSDSSISAKKVVLFNSMGGSGVFAQYIMSGENAEVPDVPVKDFYQFIGWYTSEDDGATLSSSAYNFSTAVTDDITLYAKWIQKVFFVSENGSNDAFVDEETPYGDGTLLHPFATVKKALSAIYALNNSTMDFTIIVDGHISESQIRVTSSSVKCKSLTIQGKNGNEIDVIDGNEESYVISFEYLSKIYLKDITITNGAISSLSSGGAMTVNYETTTVELENVIVSNSKNNYYVYASSRYYYGNGGGIYLRKGNLNLKQGTRICNNSTYLNKGKGGGIYISGGTLTMEDGAEISNNTSGGLYVNNSDAASSFIMNGGLITNNTGTGISIETSNVSNSSSFIMNGGEVSNNSGDGIYVSGYGYQYRPQCTINNGLIKKNLNTGIYVSSYSVFTMNDAIVEENNVHGLYLHSSSVVINVNGGTVRANKKAGIYLFGYNNFNFKDSLVVPYENESNYIELGYFSSTCSSLRIDSAYSSSVLVALKPSSYLPERIVLSSASSLTEEILSKFILVPSEDGYDWRMDITEDPKQAVLKTASYPIVYKDAGGEDFSGVLASYSPESYTQAASVSLKEPSKTGYTFLGWYKDWYERDGVYRGLGKPLSSISGLENKGSVTLYAAWVKSSYDVNIGTRVISVDSDTETCTFTASEGFESYLWSVDGTFIEEGNEIWTVSEDGRTLSYDSEKIISGWVYTVKVSAIDENGVAYWYYTSVSK